MENSNFYEELKKYSISQHVSINKIERALGYPRNALNNYKYGRVPSGDRLLEVANYIGISPYDLLGISENKETDDETLN